MHWALNAQALSTRISPTTNSPDQPMKHPLELPAEFNENTSLLQHSTESGSYHEVRRSCRFACDLVANGTEPDLELASKVLDSVLRCQIIDRSDIHCGNFLWMAEDIQVQDLNAVVFCLEHLIPMLIRYEDRLLPTVSVRVREAIATGLEEVRRLDVWIGYSNITALSILACCLGGELLSDGRSLAYGRSKLKAWVQFTAISGHVLEFNSPTYASVTIRSLGLLRNLVRCQECDVLAEMMLWRMGLSYLLHLHAGTGRLAGPHGRAYQPSITGDADPEELQFESWLDSQVLPPWLRSIRSILPPSFTVDEGILHSEQIFMKTAHQPDFAFGSVSRSVHPQGNAVIVHLKGQPDTPSGALYVRHILDDKWLGDFYHETDRSFSRNLMDEGDFLGSQMGTSVLGAYAPRAGTTSFKSSRTAFIWTAQVPVTDIFVNDELLSDYSQDLAPDSRLTICTPEVMFLLKPLHVSGLLQQPSMRIQRYEGDLVCEIYHFRSQVQKRFWDLAWPGAFYKGRPVCLFYLGVMARRGMSSRSDQMQRWAELELHCEIDEPQTRTHLLEPRAAVATASTTDGTFQLDIDLMDFRHRTGKQSFQGLEGPYCRQRTFAKDRGLNRLTVEDVEIEATHANITFCRNRSTDSWALIQNSPQPGQISVRIGENVQTVPITGMGTALYENGQLSVRQVQS